MKGKKLSEKQKLFCLYYLESFNATQSYIKAFTVKHATARTEGCVLLSNPNVKAEIRRLKKIQDKQIWIKDMDVLNQIIKIAFANMGDFVKWHSKETYVLDSFGRKIQDPETGDFLKTVQNYMEIKDSAYCDTILVHEISEGKDGMKIKLKDSKWALDYLVKHFDMFKDNFKERIEEEKLEILKKQNNIGENDKELVCIFDDIPKSTKKE